MSEPSSDLSEEQKQALRLILEALHTHLRIPYKEIIHGTSMKRDDIPNFMRGKSRNPSWLPEAARRAIELASENRKELRRAFPDLDAAVVTLTGQPLPRKPSRRNRLMREGARAFLYVEDKDAEEIAARYGDMHFLCYRHSSRPDLMVCMALRINALDPTAKVVTFTHLYRSLEGDDSRTGGIVLRQVERSRRIFLVGSTQRGGGMFTMALNEPSGRGRLFPYLNGLMMGVNAPRNVLAARMLCIPTGEDRSTRNLHDDVRIGARPTAEVQEEIRGLLARLQPHQQDVVLKSLDNTTGEQDVLMLRHPG